MQEQLVEILRHKGIGPKGSKQLSSVDIASTPHLLWSKDCSLTTKATFLTALLLLERNEEEEKLVDLLRINLDKLPRELHFILTKKVDNYTSEVLLKLIDKIDLSKEEAEKSSKVFLSTQTEDYLQAAYLEALRLKRETDLENKVFYDYFLKESSRIMVDCEPIIEIGDSYDGVERNFNFDLFVGLVLASMGYKVLLTGNETVAPKKGITHHQVLKLAGKNPLIGHQESTDQLLHLGITYLDQAIFHPEMWQKTNMRTEMVKRPFLATFEKILSPICSTQGNLVATSYTHANYKLGNIEILKSSPFVKQALNIKGLEGTVQPKSNISTLVLHLNGETVTESNYKFSGDIKETDLDVNVSNTLELGLDYIKNYASNSAKNYVENTVCMLLLHFELEDSQEEIINKIRTNINKNLVFELWNSLK